MVNKKPYLQRLKELHRRKTGEVLSDEDALVRFETLIALVSAIYHPVSRVMKNDNEPWECLCEICTSQGNVFTN